MSVAPNIVKARTSAYFDKPAAEPEWKALHAIADAAAPKFAKATAAVLNDLRESVKRPALVEALAKAAAGSRKPGGILKLADFGEFRGALGAAWLEMARPMLPAAALASVPPLLRFLRITKRVYPIAKEKRQPATPQDVAQGISAGLDLTNPESIAFLEDHGAEMVTEIGEETEEAIKQIVIDGFEHGNPVPQMADEIEAIIGLTSRQAQSISKLIDTLSAAGRSASDIAAIAEEKRRRLIRERAESIARTETIFASNRGQQALWMQAKRAGLIDPKTMGREWISTPDDRECPICAALDGTVVGLEQKFTSGKLASLTPPIHVRCRCALGLAFLVA